MHDTTTPTKSAITRLSFAPPAPKSDDPPLAFPVVDQSGSNDLNSDDNESRKAELCAEINRVIKPLNALAPRDVHIRTLFVVSDEINHYGGKFDTPELTTIAGLAVDCPILVGHRKDQLPIGRVFKTELVPREGRMWVKAYFYWLSTASDADTLVANIDGGVYKECSIGFTFRKAECGVCGADYRACEHGENADDALVTVAAQRHFIYRDVRRVLEISLVYRGAVPGAGLGECLSAGEMDLLAESAGPDLPTAQITPD